MTDYRLLKIPSREHLDVQILDGTQEHHILQIITSKSRDIRPDRTLYTFKLYDVGSDGSLMFLEKNENEPKFINERFRQTDNA
jgi:hypothetical protein